MTSARRILLAGFAAVFAVALIGSWLADRLLPSPIPDPPVPPGTDPATAVPARRYIETLRERIGMANTQAKLNAAWDGVKRDVQAMPPAEARAVRAMLPPIQAVSDEKRGHLPP